MFITTKKQLLMFEYSKKLKYTRYNQYTRS